MRAPLARADCKLFRLGQQHAQTFFAQADKVTGASLTLSIQHEFDAFLECGILARGFLRFYLRLYLRLHQRFGNCRDHKLKLSASSCAGFTSPAVHGAFRRPQLAGSTI